MYTLEMMFEIWDDDNGECIEIGADRDGLDCIEIRVKNDGKLGDRIILSYEQAALLVEAIQKLLENYK